VLFICSLFKKRSDFKDLDEIAAHCTTELAGVARLTVTPSMAGDPIDRLKFTNITNLFFFMHKQIADCFGPDFGAHITSSPSEKFIPDSARPVVVRAAPGNYPLPMLLTHLASCESLDRLQFFSVLDRDRLLPVIERLHHSWIVLHYSSPSRIAARCLHAVCNFLQNSDAECRLIVFAETTDMFPENLLCANWFSVTDFPSPWLQTEHLLGQFQGLVRSQANPVMMKRMATMAAHIVTTINWRRFIAVVGMADTPRIPDVVFRDGDWNLHLTLGPAELRLGPAAEARRVSLIPLRGQVAGASLKGAFKYPLENGVLKEGLTLGLSNELGPEGGVISIGSGILLATVSPLSDEGFVRPEPVF
jgi:hypothetical protein